MAIERVLARAIIAPNETSVKPGCRMISVPKKPTIIPAIRRARMTSPRNRTAPMVTNNGPVKLSAVTWARGIKVNAVKPANMPPTLISALKKNKFGLFMRRLDQPVCMINGISNMTASAFLKKTTSTTGRLLVDRRMKTLMQANINKATIIRIVARI